MLTCKICNKPIKGTSKSGLCPSCSAIARDRKGKMTRECSVCGNLIADWNKTGRCQHCWHVGRGGSSSNVPGQPTVVKIRCWNNHCGKWFYGRPDQHPKYSLCPICAAARDRMNSGGRWLQDTEYSNTAEDIGCNE